jgi:hypothetical protein
VLDKCSGVSCAARLVLAPGRTGEAAILVGLALRHLELARCAELIRALLNAFFGMPNAVCEFAAIG